MQHISSKDSTGRRKPEAEIFGNPEVQHDTQEFFNYVMAALHDETNIHRDQREREHVIDDNDRRSLLHNSIKYWHTYTAQNDSIVTKYWRGMEIGLTICRRCNYRTVTAQTSDLITCPIEPGNLAQSLEQFTGAEFLTDYKCLPCQKHNLGLGESDRRLYFSRLPDRMALRIERGTVSGKNMSRFTFPLQNLDMEPYFIPKEPKDERRIDRTDARVAETADTERQFRPPFKYDCYAVICHSGRSLTSGHYIAYVRDPASNDPTDWIRFNDAAVDYVKVGSNSPDDVKETFFGKGDQQAYLMFYERKA
jgi:ubiquitin carboxyl-terminal hydrolase 8